MRYQIRGYPAATWASTNPVLAAREEGIETDTNKRKIGDGVTAWTSLEYLPSATGTTFGTTAGTAAEGNDARITGAAQKSANLSDLASTSTARTNLSLGDSATKNVGTSAGTVAAGDDSRLTNSRTPTAHAASHASGGSDAITVAESQVTNLTADLAAKANVLTRTALKTSNYTAAMWDLVPCDTSAGAFTITLPAASGGRGRIALKLVTAGNTLNLALTGSDKFNASTGATTGTLTLTNQGILAESDGSGIWTITADDIPLTQLDARYVAPTLFDAKGDLLVGTADNAVARKAVGATGFSLVADPTQSDGLVWLDRRLPIINPVSGDWITSQFYVGNSTGTLAQDSMVPMPLYLSAAVTANSISVTVNTAVASGVIRLGAYAATAGTNRPGTLLFDAGTVDASTTGVKQLAINQALGPGLIWLVAVEQIAAVKYRGFTAAGMITPFGADNLVIQTPGQNAYRATGVTGALPASPTWLFVGNLSTNVIPIVGLVVA